MTSLLAQFGDMWRGSVVRADFYRITGLFFVLLFSLSIGRQFKKITVRVTGFLLILLHIKAVEILIHFSAAMAGC